MQKGRMLGVALELCLFPPAAPRLWHTGEDWDQVLGELVRGVRPEPVRGTGINTERQGRQLELLMGGMALPLLWSEMRAGILLLSALSLLSASLVGAGQDSGSVIPAESRPCVDCHAFEFMQRALQDLKKTAYSLDTRKPSS
ncbi:neuropeptide-like protein C4orf48 homolog isoform X3 [Catharus ustulatus]|uniref:neuropeptide-like protein C4orf48 homolog isoform X3 n=1 Tax=Catharus ustulatus TaxID=91951 RepID=UPI0014094A5E|nr:neuropeptide-like protein C4orf48 homolog isoform X3 [Catharus ustulatus]